MQAVIQQTLNLEILYSFVIIITSLMIYFGTKEIYELSSHKGLKYFRIAFLFFALAYFFRSFIKFFLVYFNVTEIMRIAPNDFAILMIFAFMYFSLISIFYLLYSVIWKKWKNEKQIIYLFHILALIISITCIIMNNHFFHLLINVFILLIACITIIFSHQKKNNYTYLAYILLAIFWTLNIIDILTPTLLYNTQIFIYLASTGIFLTILYKVLKKAGS